LVAVVPDGFQTRVVLINTTSGQAKEICSIAGVAVQGTHTVHPKHGLYHFVLRHGTQHSLVTVSLHETISRARGPLRARVNGTAHVEMWTDERFHYLHSLHCLQNNGKESDDAPCKLVGMFPSPDEPVRKLARNRPFLDLLHVGELAKLMHRYSDKHTIKGTLSN